MLTHKQRTLLMFIHERLSTVGVPPSFEEMKDALELKSKSGIHRLITGLEERGFLRRMPHRARALEVLKLPEDQPMGPARLAAPSSQAEANLREFSKRHLPAQAQSPGSNDNELPLVGRIAAGLPIEAINNPTNTIDVPPMLRGRGENFVLEVQGDSMIEAGINDGDLVIIERCETAKNGEIVVALVDHADVTLKRWRQHADFVALEPANSRLETQVLTPDRVSVQGKLKGLMRQYH